MNENFLGKNIFLLYRGTNDFQEGDNSDDTKEHRVVYTNSKYVASRIFYELSKYEECNVFFAPCCYAQGNNYVNELDNIFSSVKIALIVMSKGMLDRCFLENSHDIYENDTLYKELKIVFSRKDITLKFIKTDDYDMTTDLKNLFALFPDTFHDNKGEFSQVTFEYHDNAELFFVELYNSIHGDILNNRFKIKDSSSSFIIEDLLKCSSTTMIRNNIVQYIIDILEQSGADELQKIINSLRGEDGGIIVSNLKSLVEMWIEKIADEVNHFSAINQLYKEEFLIGDNERISIEQVLSLDDNDEALDKIKQIHDALQTRKRIFSESGKKCISRDDGILTFSHSEYVANFLSGCESRLRSTCKLYICETRSKSLELFYDAQNIFCDTAASISGERTFITDSSVYQLMKEGKINKVVLGACSIVTKNGILTQAINTAGSESIIILAKFFHIPVFIVSNTQKHIDNFSPRDQYLLTKEFKKKHGEQIIINNRTYNYGCDEVTYDEVDRTENMFFISENGLDIEPVLEYFIQDIWKDSRKLKIVNSYFIKGCEPYAFEIEKRIFDVLNKEKDINVPKLLNIANENELVLERVRGARIFELFVALDELCSEGYQKAYEIKKLILEKCYEQQKKIWNSINKKIDKQGLHPYPQEKISGLLIVLLKSINLFYPSLDFDVSQVDLEIETDRFYKRFTEIANTVFRDSTVKNMIMQIEELKGLDNISTEDRLIKLKQKLYKILESDDFDGFKSNAIFDLDFSSCINLTTRYDDFIGLKMHERTYSLEIEQEILSGTLNGKKINKKEFIIGLIVRYLRFGGRKLLYKLFNPTFHDIRFKYDNEQFYFKKIVFFVNRMCPEFIKEYPCIFKIIQTLSEQPIPLPKINIFNEYINIMKKEEVVASPPWLGTWGEE